MKKYAYIKDGRINQFLYAFSEEFPNIPLDERFSEEIIRNCIEVNPTDELLKEGMDYNSETGEFSEHIDEVVPQIIEDEIYEEVIEDEIVKEVIEDEIVEEVVENVTE